MEHKPIILIVEDEVAIRSGLIDVFLYHGFEVDNAATGPEGLRMAQTGRYDMILLDVMLPGMDGFEICNRLRSEDREQAIIMLTARSGDDDIVQGLQLGADDYVAKPFSVTQLVLRVQAVLRRTNPDKDRPSQICLGEQLRIDLQNLAGNSGDESLHFTRREADLLSYLHAQNERPVPREELLHKVWGYARDLNIETRTVDIHIAKLRRKIEPDPASPQFLITVRGAGYRLMSHE